MTSALPSHVGSVSQEEEDLAKLKHRHEAAEFVWTSASVYTNIESLCRSTETNIVLYANYTLNKINK